MLSQAAVTGDAPEHLDVSHWRAPQEVGWNPQGLKLERHRFAAGFTDGSLGELAPRRPSADLGAGEMRLEHWARARPFGSQPQSAVVGSRGQLAPGLPIRNDGLAENLGVRERLPFHCVGEVNAVHDDSRYAGASASPVQANEELRGFAHRRELDLPEEGERVLAAPTGRPEGVLRQPRQATKARQNLLVALWVWNEHGLEVLFDEGW